MKKVLIILDGLMEKNFEKVDLLELILENKKENAKLTFKDFSIENKDIDSLNCIMNILGYSPLKENIGDRAYYEGLSKGIKDYKYILRCNIVRVENNVLKDFTGGDIPPEAIGLLNGFHIENAFIHPCYKYKNLLVIKNCVEDLEKVKFYPPHFYINAPFENILPKSEFIKGIINSSYKLFKENNIEGLMLWPWGVSRKVNLEEFQKRYNTSGALVSGIDLLNGIGKALNLECKLLKNCTGDIDTNLKLKLKESINLIQKKDFLIVHINGLDEASHRKNLKEKLEFLHKVKKEFLFPFIESTEKCNRKIIITCDHRSDSFTGVHEKGNVPFITIN